MPAVHPRMVAREEGVVLTTLIDAGSALDLAEADRGFEIELTWMLWMEFYDTTPKHEIEAAWEFRALIRKMREIEGPHHRRANPKARSMRRKDGRYAVRKDHATAAKRKERDAGNASRTSRVKNSNAQQRKLAKLESRSGDPRVIGKLIRLGDLLIGNDD